MMARLVMEEAGVVVNLPIRQERGTEAGAAPEVVHLHIHLGEAVGASPAAQAPGVRERRPGHPLLRLGALLGLLGAVFLAGNLTAGGQRLPAGVDPSAFAAGFPAMPGTVPASPVTAMPPSFPPGLRQQLAQRPRIVMPAAPTAMAGAQGQAPAPAAVMQAPDAAPARNAFGLEH
ncbi:hypothetical protein [Roseomonas mucosa]|uniref:hypothetical protein n=1 Tax=Roseomonas mucosa TaxID=207340 RepID=UPI002B415971|nr:hypothetical protein [Roseomonas mucosa]QDD96929.1 hypothetical protein ADP8_05090 [Roseomonas mucosa]